MLRIAGGKISIMLHCLLFKKEISLSLYCQRLLYKNKAIANSAGRSVPNRIISSDLSAPAVSVGSLSAWFLAGLVNYRCRCRSLFDQKQHMVLLVKLRVIAEGKNSGSASPGGRREGRWARGVVGPGAPLGRADPGQARPEGIGLVFVVLVLFLREQAFLFNANSTNYKLRDK